MNNMSINEKKPIVSMISNLLIYSVYLMIVFNRYRGSSLTTEEEFKFWATVILVLIPVLIVSKIVLYIIYSIINTMITGQKEEGFLVDEFGKLIESRATRNFYHVFMIGFLLSVGSLLIG